MKLSSTSRQKRLFDLFSDSTLLFALICSLALLLVSCGDNSTGPNGGNGGGNGNGNGNEIGTEPTFSNVLQIFEANCGGCHIGSSTSGVQLDSYDNVINSVGNQYGENVVNPGDAANSPLVDKIEASPQQGDRMPQGGSPLSSDRIAQIREWIDNGAENN